MARKNLEDAFQEAAKIAGKLPKNLQEAGFNRALDEVLGAKSRSASRQNAGSGRTRRVATDASGTGKSLATNLDSIDRTKHPDVGATDRVADQAMKVLQIANDDHGVDGLSASVIASILTVKFRLPATRQGVGQALSRETRTVNVRTKDGQKLFHLMAPGEAYLSRLRSGESTDRDSRKAPQRKATGARKKIRRKGGTRKTVRKKTAPKKKTAKASGKKRSGRPGPKVAIAELVSAGFFKQKRRISDIQSELQHRRGHTFTIQDLSSALVRSVRDETLQRARDESGQYEYGAS